MANEVMFIYTTGQTLTFGVYYDNAGTITARESGTSLTEQPAASGVYKGSPTSIVEGDYVTVSDASGVIGDGYYMLDPMNDKLDVIDGVVDDILVDLNKTTFVYDETTTSSDGDKEQVLIGGPSHC